MIRIVGLSATLPNYRDVASFLGVDAGLFYFDASYRPVPLEMQFVGVSERNILQAKNIMDDVCYEKVRCLAVREATVMAYAPMSKLDCNTEQHTLPD